MGKPEGIGVCGCTCCGLLAGHFLFLREELPAAMPSSARASRIRRPHPQREILPKARHEPVEAGSPKTVHQQVSSSGRLLDASIVSVDLGLGHRASGGQ